MSIKPYVVPAQSEATYDMTRVSALTVVQQLTGGPLSISFEIRRYRIVGGVPDESPGGAVRHTVQLSLAALQSDTALAAALVAVNEFAVAQAVQAGLLETQA